MTKDGAWKTGNIAVCLKVGCINRDKKCDICMNFSEYKTEEKKKDG
jgi:hypothetical protein